MKAKISKKNGFTLVETLVAVTVLILSIVGPMSIAANSLFSAYYSRDKITSYYLAQEGIELVRFYRDNLYLKTRNNDPSGDPLEWLGGSGGQLYKCFSASFFSNNIPPLSLPSGINGSGCTIDINDSNDTQVTACPLSGCPPLRFKPGSGTNPPVGIYTYDNNGDVTKFTRTITITPVNNQTVGDYKEAIVKSEITWTNGVAPKSFAIYDRLYNWQRQ